MSVCTDPSLCSGPEWVRYEDGCPVTTTIIRATLLLIIIHTGGAFAWAEACGEVLRTSEAIVVAIERLCLALCNCKS